MKLYEELGDVGFFVLLAAMIHGDSLTSEEWSELKEMMKYAEETGEPDDLNLTIAIAYVAGYKDVINYPEKFYQIKEGELAQTIPDRVDQTVPAIRKVRIFFNGEWAESRDLIATMQEHGEKRGWEGDEAKAIEQLFVLAGIDSLNVALI